MKPKKAELSITVIIAAVIGLIVLVVLIAIFTNTTRTTVEDIGSCAAKGGLCADQNNSPTKPNDKCGESYPIPLIVSGDCQSASPKGLCCLKAEN